MKSNLSNLILNHNATIRQSMKAIQENGVRGVFICEEGELLGIVMDSDIRRAILKNVNLDVSVKTVMKTNPFVISDKLSKIDTVNAIISSGKLLVPVINQNNIVTDYHNLNDILNDFYAIKNESKEKSYCKNKNILVIGGAGYIGSVLISKLVSLNHNVRVLDLLLYGKDNIKHISQERRVEFIRGDCRDQKVIQKALENIEIVIHLGEIVGDPACTINEVFTIDVNYSATQMIVDQCIRLGIEKFIFASSCSVYGQNDNEVNELSHPNPVSLYARCKIESEHAILDHHSNFFSPTVLRLATVHGKSFRQRFDLVINFFAIKAIIEKKIQIFGGKQWRPFISVHDICKGIIDILNSSKSVVRNQIYNLGDSRENYTLNEVGSFIKEIIDDVEIEILSDKNDNRNYKVNFDKIKNDIGFTADYTIKDTIIDFYETYRTEHKFSDYLQSKYYNKFCLT